MSILVENRGIALEAYSQFHNWKNVGNTEDVKNYLNAVQKTMLYLGTQGFKRMILYITAQANKKDPKEWGALYNHLAHYLGEDETLFQYNALHYSTQKIAEIEGGVSFFLLCLKRLASAKYQETK